jgi:cytochrome c553
MTTSLISTLLRSTSALVLAVAFVSPVIASSSKKADPSDKKGQLLFETCKACHGPHGEGNDNIQVPAIAGMPEWYLISTLKKFKHGIRGAHPDDRTGLQMRPMARQLIKEANLLAVAKTVAHLPKTEIKHLLHGDAVKGKAGYMLCQACHGAKGEGNVAMKAPPLNQLPDWYIVAQLEKFKAGIRGVHPKDIEGKQMRPMAMALANKQVMTDIASYIATLGASNTVSPSHH